MIKIILILLGLAIVVILGLAAFKPDTFRVVRRATIKAPPEKVFSTINDFHQWPQWSPWEKLDPAMKHTHSGTASGVGAAYAWEGNKKVGAGSMEVLESMPWSRIKIKLDFIRPFAGHNITEFTLEPEANNTVVTWAMQGPAPFISKLMQVFMSMDTMIGKDFEEGLNNLGRVSEQ